MSTKKSQTPDIWRPDVYICNDCNHRFDKTEYKTKKEEGLVFQRAVCPKCKSENIRVSSWSEKDFKTKK